MLPPWIVGGTTTTPAILNEMSGLYRPTASNADLDRLFSTGALINAFVTYRADNLALVKWVIKDENGIELPSENWYAQLLTHGMPDIVRRCEISLCFRGYTLIWKRRNRVSNQIVQLRWMNFNLYQLDKGWQNGLQGFKVYANSTAYEPMPVNYIPRHDGIYWHMVDLEDDFDGVSPVEVAFMHAGIDVESATTQLAFFQNMAIPALLIQPAADQTIAPTEAETDDFLALLRRVAKGVINAGRTVITPNRWDVKELQPRFQDLAMAELTQAARESVSMALRVPIELLLPSASNYAQAYEARRGWIQTWLQPQAEWYASVLTDQLIRPLNSRWHIEPNYENVPGQKEDLARRTEVINVQVQGVLRDLYSAQEELDIEPDLALKGLYLVQGIPVPKEALREYYKTAGGQGQQPGAPGTGGFPGGGNPFGGGGNPFGGGNHSLSEGTGLSTAKLGDAGPGLSPRPPKSMTPRSELYLSDEAHKELNNWRHVIARKGLDYPFEARALPSETITFGKALLSTAPDLDSAFDTIRQHAYYALQAAKAAQPAYVSLQLAPASIVSLLSLRPLLEDLLGPDAKWQDPETYHLTLAYVPDIDDDTLSQVCQSLPQTMPAGLTVEQLAHFDNHGDGYPIHLRIAKTHELSNYQRAVHSAFLRHGVMCSPLSKPDAYQPHVTLAYAQRPPVGMQSLDSTVGQWQANRLRVKGCTVSRDGYKTVHGIVLGAAKSESREGDAQPNEGGVTLAEPTPSDAGDASERFQRHASKSVEDKPESKDEQQSDRAEHFEVTKLSVVNDAAKAQFEEQEHPRAEDGKFTSSGDSNNGGENKQSAGQQPATKPRDWHGKDSVAADKSFDAHTKEPSIEEADALHSYVNQYAHVGVWVNMKLRSPDSTTPPKMDRREKQLLDSLDSVTKSNELHEPTMLYRGVSGPFAEKLIGLHAGDQFLDRGFGSTSLSKTTPAEGLSDNDAIIQISAPKGTKGVYINSAFRKSETRQDSLNGKYAEQQEFLLGRDTKYRVTSVKANPDGGPRLVNVEIVNE